MAERTVDISSPILSRNERLAAELRERFARTRTFVVNVLSSPGSGKTSTILATDALLRAHGLRSAVIEGDIASDVDAVTMKEAGIPAVQINTGGLCHLEGNMISSGGRRARCGRGACEHRRDLHRERGEPRVPRGLRLWARTCA